MEGEVSLVNKNVELQCEPPTRFMWGIDGTLMCAVGVVLLLPLLRDGSLGNITYILPSVKCIFQRQMVIIGEWTLFSTEYSGNLKKEECEMEEVFSFILFSIPPLTPQVLDNCTVLELYPQVERNFHRVLTAVYCLNFIKFCFHHFLTYVLERLWI